MSTERRLHADSLPPAGGLVTLTDEARAHARVLRLGPGDPVVLFDGSGNVADAVVEAVTPELLVRSSKTRVESAPGPSLTLVLALPRAGKLDDVLRAVTELGVARVRLATTERSVGDVPAAKLAKKQDRWDRVVREAARQSERGHVPEVCAPAPLMEVAEHAPDQAVRVVFTARGGGALDLRGATEVIACVGPEGGFSDGELDALDALGFRRVSLGPTVLRMQTAAISATAVLLHTLRTGGSQSA